MLLRSLQDPSLIGRFADGQVCVVPCDTIYGLACSAKNPSAAARLYALKSRERKPGTVIAASVEQLIDLGIPRKYLRAVEHLWPNPISVVLPDSRGLEYLDQGLQSLAVRIPKHEPLLALLNQTGPLLTTSANHPGKLPAHTIAAAQAYFGDAVDCYVDGGDMSGRLPSTVVRVVDDAIVVLRDGAVRISESGQIIGTERS